MDKPDVDSIEGLSPAISIDQKTTSRNPRSTVGTVTEIYDYLRLLWSRVGHPHCPICGAPIAGQSAEQIIDQVMELDGGHALHGARAGRARPQGRVREAARGAARRRLRAREGRRRAAQLDEAIELDKKYKHDISVVVDRLVMRHDLRKRLADSIETAVGLADGIVEIEIVPREGDKQAAQMLTFSEKFACLKCGTSMPELEPRIFSFNSPHGACERCTGLGSQMEIDPELVVPDPTLSIGEGALAPWAASASQYYEQISSRSPSSTASISTRRGRSCRPSTATLFLHGTGRRARARHLQEPLRAQAHVRDALRGDRPEPRAPLPRDGLRVRCASSIEQFMALVPCPACEGSRLRPESRAVLVGGMAIHEFTALSVRQARRWLDEVVLTETERHIARLILREIEERLRFLEDVGIGYLSLDRARGDAVGRRGAAHPPGDADRLGARRACSTSSTSRRSACTSATTRS